MCIIFGNRAFTINNCYYKKKNTFLPTLFFPLKKKSLPTYPDFQNHVTGNKHFFFRPYAEIFCNLFLSRNFVPFFMIKTFSAIIFYLACVCQLFLSWKLPGLLNINFCIFYSTKNVFMGLRYVENFAENIWV